MKVLLYPTKAKPYLTNKDIISESYELKDKFDVDQHNEILNCKVVASFELNEWDKYAIEKPNNKLMAMKLIKNMLNFTNDIEENLINNSCLSLKELWDYAKPTKNYENKQRWIYAWHIDNLKIFDEPMRLNKIYHSYQY